MTLGFPTLLIKILACIPIDRYKKIGTKYIKDTCLRTPLAVARGHGNSLVARFLRDDRQAKNKQYNRNK
jgi:hypothetical protein